MAEQPLYSDREAALALSAPVRRAPSNLPRVRQRPWFWITLVRLAVPGQHNAEVLGGRQGIAAGEINALPAEGIL